MSSTCSPPERRGSVRREAPRRTVARRRALTSAGLLSLTALGATACSGEAARLGMPDPITEQGERILTLWQGSWVAAFAVGGVVWGLIIWAVLFHRKRSDDLPPQVRYNMPIEFLYTVVPFIVIAVLFYFTARDENYLQKTSARPDVVVNVTAFQWSWQFDYPDPADPSWTNPVAQPRIVASVVGVAGQKPVVAVPVGQKVRFNLESKDVIHSFWVPSFLYKLDVMPGYHNHFEVTPTKTGTYEGRCAELCGVDHSRMLFQLKVVTPAEYQTFLAQHPVGSAQ
ncbi:MAG TPA: cytochrome c oxidase subunit II [Streptosporangiaceae bacterium]|nr:cytochrome c oxidase subunit II [Streptosporangiaceae bacterium]